jgi:glutamate synthase (NADPH) small chain
MGKPLGFKEIERKNFNKRPVEERIKDYKNVYIPLKEEEIIDQAARCMNCGTPFCNFGCPLGNMAPEFNDLVYRGKWKEAYKRLSLTNNFPEFTGRLCPALCEAACTLGINRKSVSVREIEYTIIEKAFKEGWVKPRPPKIRTNKKIAVIGSGPSGLSAAAELNSVGHSVTVFEKSDEIGGFLRYGIPDFKLDKSIIERRVKILEEEGIIFKTGIDVGNDVTTEELQSDFDAVLLCGGSRVPRDLKIKGRSFIGVHFAHEFLSQQNMKTAGKDIEKMDINAQEKNVVIIGGGDTGSDCVGTAVRQGAKKVYQFEIMPKPKEERDETNPWPTYPRLLKTTTSHEEGCTREWCVLTKEIEDKYGEIERLHYSKVEWNKDENGRMAMKEILGSDTSVEVDLVILAMGFLHPQHQALINDLGLKLDNRGNVLADEKHMTSVSGIFAAGDMRTGQSLIVKCIHEGRQAAKDMDEYLSSETYLMG